MTPPLHQPISSATIPDGTVTLADLAAEVQASIELADTALQVAPVTSVDGDTGAVDLSGTYAQVAQATFRPGRLWLIVGSSIANGAGASNAAYAYPTQARHMAGTWDISTLSVVAGYPGSTVAERLTELPALLSTNSPGSLFFEVGPNDAGTTEFTQFQADVAAVVALGKRAGIPVVITTPTPRTAAVDSAEKALDTARQAAWIRLWAPGQGLVIADFHAALVDTATGYLSATYDSGDGIHPNDRGHQTLARVAADAMRSAMSYGVSYPAPSAGLPGGLVVNPTLVSGNGLNPNTSGSVTATGTAPTQAMETDTTGRSPFGRWAKLTLAASADSAYYRSMSVSATGATTWEVGDVVALAGYVEITPTVGDWEAAVAAGTAQARLQLRNQSGTVIASHWDRCAGREVASGVYAIGHAFNRYTIAAGVTGLSVLYGVTVPNGMTIESRMAYIDVVNLTKLSLT